MLELPCFDCLVQLAMTQMNKMVANEPGISGISEYEPRRHAKHQSFSLTQPPPPLLDAVK